MTITREMEKFGERLSNATMSSTNPTHILDWDRKKTAVKEADKYLRYDKTLKTSREVTFYPILSVFREIIDFQWVLSIRNFVFNSTKWEGKMNIEHLRKHSEKYNTLPLCTPQISQTLALTCTVHKHYFGLSAVPLTAIEANSGSLRWNKWWWWW
jgi:hypothetical protein